MGSVGRDVHDEPSTQFIGVYLQGVNNVWGAHDDMAFILDVMETFRVFYGWSARVYGIGHSNGAALANRLAVNSGMGFSGVGCSATQLLAAPATTEFPPHNQLQPTSDTVPVAYLSLHGDS